MPTECYPTGKRVTPKEIVDAVKSESWTGAKYLPTEDPKLIGLVVYNHEQDRYVPANKEVQLSYYWLYAAEWPGGVAMGSGIAKRRETGRKNALLEYGHADCRAEGT